ncbi:MAG: DUF2339 domain-containing protein [Mycobacterium sp.]
MTEPDQAIIARLSSDVAVIGAYLARASADLVQLERIVAQRSAQPQFQAQPWSQPWPAPAYQQPPTAQPAMPAPHPAPSGPRSDGWIGKALAVAGVAVTLVGVALLLVLAAQAGILRPEVRVFAGAALAAGLVGAAWRLKQRPGGRVGAIALAATGIAAAYIDVIAVTTVYDWVSPPIGLVIAAVVGCAGLLLARRWDTEHLGLLVLVPLIGLAPVVADGFTLVLVGFMLALGAASVPVQLGKDWVGMHAARMAASTLPLLVALALEQSPLLAVACALAAALAIGSALILLRYTKNAVAMALLSAAGTMPVLAASIAVDRVIAALLAAVLAVALFVVVLLGERLPMVTAPVRTVWSALAAVSALVAVTVAFDGPVAGPVLLAMAVVLAVAGRGDRVARWCALGFGVVGGLFYLAYAPLTTLIRATSLGTPIAVSTLIASVLVVAFAATIVWSWPADWSWATAAVVALYGITKFAVTAGVLLGGQTEGFFAGHVVATICWIALAAGVFRYATRIPRARRSLPIGGGMAIVAAAMAKLFLFDLGTLDGIFRVVVFIVVGLALLGMGAGYARLLAQQDDREPQT